MQTVHYAGPWACAAVTEEGLPSVHLAFGVQEAWAWLLDCCMANAPAEICSAPAWGRELVCTLRADRLYLVTLTDGMVTRVEEYAVRVQGLAICGQHAKTYVTQEELDEYYATA